VQLLGEGEEDLDVALLHHRSPFVNRGVNGLAFLVIVTRRPRQRVINHVTSGTSLPVEEHRRKRSKAQWRVPGPDEFLL